MSHLEKSKLKGGDESLPPDCWQSVFNHLNQNDLQTASFACKNFLTYSDILMEHLKVTHPEITMLSGHIKRFIQLKKIDLTYFTGNMDEAIQVIAGSSLSLETLDIKAASFETASLRKLGSNPNMKNLKALNYFQVGRFDNNDLLVIANSFPNLEALNFGHLDSPQVHVTDEGIEFLASKLNLLKRITIYGQHSSISDRSLFASSSNCVGLKVVSIVCAGVTVTESGIGLLLRKLRNLETLSIAYIKIIDSSFVQSSSPPITIENSISYAKALTTVKFCYMNISDNLLREIARAKLRLKRLWLYNCKEFTVTGLLVVLSNYNLNSLRITKSSIVDEDMELLLNGNVGNLTRVEVSQCQVTNSTLFRLATKCPSLVDIMLNNTAIGEKVINNIPSTTNYTVQNLFLASCSQINHATVIRFTSTFPNLRFINLRLAIQLTSKDIEVILKGCKFIRALLLRGYRGVKIFEADDPELLELNLEVLTLPDSCINGEGLGAIVKKCPRLVTLDLSDCKNVGTEDIKQVVQNIKTLTNLDVCGCDYGDLLEWMLATGNLASLKKLYLGKMCTKKLRDKLLDHGCLLLEW